MHKIPKMASIILPVEWKVFRNQEEVEVSKILKWKKYFLLKILWKEIVMPEFRIKISFKI